MGKQKSDIVSDMMRGTQIVKAISDALKKKGGDDSHMIKILGEHSLFPGRIADILLGRDGKFPSLALAADLIPENWEIIEDVEPSKFQIKDLELVPFLEGGDGRSIKGDVLRKRAVSLKANLGLSDAKYILDHQDEIPVEFRGKYLVFTGTLLCYPGGSLRVAYLRWVGGCWYLDFDWLEHGWGGSDRLLRGK